MYQNQQYIFKDEKVLNLVWNSIPMQLAKENKKYIYGQVREGARAKDFELAIQWLLDCGLIHKVNRVKKPALPLKAYLDLDVFKIFLLDIGLLIAMTDLDAKVIYRRESDIYRV